MCDVLWVDIENHYSWASPCQDHPTEGLDSLQSVLGTCCLCELYFLTYFPLNAHHITTLNVLIYQRSSAQFLHGAWQVYSVHLSTVSYPGPWRTEYPWRFMLWHLPLFPRMSTNLRPKLCLWILLRLQVGVPDTSSPGSQQTQGGLQICSTGLHRQWESGHFLPTRPYQEGSEVCVSKTLPNLPPFGCKFFCWQILAWLQLIFE